MLPHIVSSYVLPPTWRQPWRGIEIPHMSIPPLPPSSFGLLRQNSNVQSLIGKGIKIAIACSNFSLLVVRGRRKPIFCNRGHQTFPVNPSVPLSLFHPYSSNKQTQGWRRRGQHRSGLSLLLVREGRGNFSPLILGPLSSAHSLLRTLEREGEKGEARLLRDRIEKEFSNPPSLDPLLFPSPQRILRRPQQGPLSPC